MRPNQKLKSLISEEIKAVRKEQVLNEKRVAFFEAFANSPVDSFSELEKIEVVRYMLAEEILTEEMLTEENLDEFGGLARGAMKYGGKALGYGKGLASAGYQSATGLARRYAPMVRQTAASGRAVRPGQFASTTGLGKAYEALRKSSLASFFFGKASGVARVGAGWLPKFKQIAARSPYAVPAGLAALLGISGTAAAALLSGDQEPTPEQTEKIRSAVGTQAGGAGGAGGGGAAGLPADWSRFAGQSDQHATLARKWIEATGGGALQEAALPSDASFSAFQDWYGKTMGEEGGHFGPARAIELIDQAAPGAAAPEAAPEAAAPEAAAPEAAAPAAPAAPQAAPADRIAQMRSSSADLNAKETADLQAAITALDSFIAAGDKKMPRKDLAPAIKGLIPATRPGPFRPSYLKGQVEKAIQARSNLEESILNESVYNRWQTLIRN